MKKILFLAASALMVASCNEDFKDWAEAQPAEATSTIEEVKLSLSKAFESLDLDAQTAETVKLFAPSLTAGATVNGFDVTLTAGENSYGMSADANGVVKTEELNKAVIALYNRERVMRDITVTAKTHASVNASAGTISVPVSATTDTKVMVKTTNYAEFFYEIGGETGWSTVHPLWGANFDGKYVGYAYLCDQFKFKPNADNWDDDLECVGEGKIGQGSDNCPAPATPGLHRIEIDLEAMTYAITNFGGVSIIGDATGDSSWGTDIDMEYSSAEGCYIVTAELVPGSFKFRTDHAWNGVNWGGEDPNKLEIDKGNCSIATGGLCIVRFWPSYSGNGRYEVEAL